jgi:hypothetical protein
MASIFDPIHSCAQVFEPGIASYSHDFLAAMRLAKVEDRVSVRLDDWTVYLDYGLEP